MAKELKMQSICTQWFHNNFPQFRGRLRRVKNELDNHPYKSKTDIFKQLSENKATGVIPGDSDLYWVDFHNTYIELKTDTGVQSPEQKKFEQMVTSFGHHYVIVKSVEDFQSLMLRLISP